MGRNIKYIVVHCTAGNPKQTVRDLEAIFKNNGWKNPGYHYVVTVDGKIHQMLDEDKVSNGVRGYNNVCINVAYTDGLNNLDTRSDEQKRSLVSLLKLLRKKYPNAVIQRHRDFSLDLNKNGKIEKCEWIEACPCFDAKTEYKEI